MTNKLVHKFAECFKEVAGEYPATYTRRVDNIYRQQLSAFATAKKTYSLTDQDVEEFLSWFFKTKTNNSFLPLYARTILTEQNIMEWKAQTIPI